MNMVFRRPSERTAPRMAALSVLPVFLDLHGKRVVVAGGTDAAAWKAELLAAAGAEVHVHAAGLGAEMARLLNDGEGRFVHHDGRWSPDALDGAAIAVADAETNEEAGAFFDTARLAGVPCNVIDKPAFCAFQFGSIVNRSPVVVGISTSGAAPILGQAIRRRIETLLPQSLAAWARIAQDMRAAVNDMLKPGAQRRALWEALVDRAFGPPPKPEDESKLARELRRIAQAVAPSAGCVTFVEAGEAELLTLKAVRALQSADVILHDDLVSHEVLQLARREARRIPVARHDDMNDMMVRLAKAGHHLLRLKAGNPAIIGHAGEEIARLDAEGIPVQTVPGVAPAVTPGGRRAVRSVPPPLACGRD